MRLIDPYNVPGLSFKDAAGARRDVLHDRVAVPILVRQRDEDLKHRLRQWQQFGHLGSRELVGP